VNELEVGSAGPLCHTNLLFPDASHPLPQPTATLTLQMPHLLTIALLLGLAASFFTLLRPATLAGAQLPEPLTQYVS
jgi:hypothetical protein